MPCTSPSKFGYKSDGKTRQYQINRASPEYPIETGPCGQCIECRLANARDWAVRCTDESKMHEKNSFITLTYTDEHLNSPWLVYSDFQEFIQKLRDKIGYDEKDKIHYIVTGEYGEKNKRPHWHAIIFNYWPDDAVQSEFTTELGDKIFTSKSFDTLWGKNDPDKCPNQIGTVTYESAGYVARYASKKLVHGKDGEHPYQPIFKMSRFRAIGKTFLEKFWPDVFNYGRKILFNGQIVPIPRYYEKWLKKNQPIAWEAYVTRIKKDKIAKASEIYSETVREYADASILRPNKRILEPKESDRKISKSKFRRLQENLKL